MKVWFLLLWGSVSLAAGLHRSNVSPLSQKMLGKRDEQLNAAFSPQSQTFLRNGHEPYKISKTKLNMFQLSSQYQSGLSESLEDYYHNLCQNVYQRPLDIFPVAATKLRPCVLHAGAVEGTSTTLTVTSPHSLGDVEISLEATVGAGTTLADIQFEVEGNATVRKHGRTVEVSLGEYTVGHVSIKNAVQLSPAIYRWRLRNIAEDESIGLMVVDLLWDNGRILSPSCETSNLSPLKLDSSSAVNLFPCRLMSSGFVGTLHLQSLAKTRSPEIGILVSVINEKGHLVLMQYESSKSRDSNTTVGMATTLGFVEVGLGPQQHKSKFPTGEVIIQTPVLAKGETYQWRIQSTTNHPLSLRLQSRWTDVNKTLLRPAIPDAIPQTVPKHTVQVTLRFNQRMSDLSTAVQRSRFFLSVVQGLSVASGEKTSRFNVVAVLPAISSMIGLSNDEGGILVAVNIAPAQTSSDVHAKDVEKAVRESLKDRSGPVFDHFAFKSLNFHFYKSGDPNDLASSRASYTAVLVVFLTILAALGVGICVYCCLKTRPSDDLKNQIDDWDFYATPDSYDDGLRGASISAPMSQSIKP